VDIVALFVCRALPVAHQVSGDAEAREDSDLFLMPKFGGDDPHKVVNVAESAKFASPASAARKAKEKATRCK